MWYQYTHDKRQHKNRNNNTVVRPHKFLDKCIRNTFAKTDVYKRQTSTWTWIDHPVSGLLRLTIFALFRLGFPSAPGLRPLTSPASVTRRTVLQKVRGCTYKVLPQFVNIWFQVLFHSPPGVLFTVPSQYYALSVTKEYLALRGGPRVFSQGSDVYKRQILSIPSRR